MIDLKALAQRERNPFQGPQQAIFVCGGVEAREPRRLALSRWVGATGNVDLAGLGAGVVFANPP